MYAIKIDMPNLAKGAEVVIDGLGIFKNGETVTIDKEQADAYRVHNRKQVGEYNDKGFLDYTEEQSPTLLQAFEHVKGIEVTTTTKESEETKKVAEVVETDKGKTLEEKGGDK